MKYQIDDAQRVVRAKGPAEAVATLPELDGQTDFVFHVISLEENVWRVKSSGTGKEYVVRVTDNVEYVAPPKNEEEKKEDNDIPFFYGYP